MFCESAYDLLNLFMSMRLHNESRYCFWLLRLNQSDCVDYWCWSCPWCTTQAMLPNPSSALEWLRRLLRGSRTASIFVTLNLLDWMITPRESRDSINIHWAVNVLLTSVLEGSKVRFNCLLPDCWLYSDVAVDCTLVDFLSIYVCLHPSFSWIYVDSCRFPTLIAHAQVKTLLSPTRLYTFTACLCMLLFVVGSCVLSVSHTLGIHKPLLLHMLCAHHIFVALLSSQCATIQSVPAQQ